jgi:hypothetical protein
VRPWSIPSVFYFLIVDYPPSSQRVGVEFQRRPRRAVTGPLILITTQITSLSGRPWFKLGRAQHCVCFFSLASQPPMRSSIKVAISTNTVGGARNLEDDKHRLITRTQGHINMRTTCSTHT